MNLVLCALCFEWSKIDNNFWLSFLVQGHATYLFLHENSFIGGIQNMAFSSLDVQCIGIFFFLPILLSVVVVLTSINVSYCRHELVKKTIFGRKSTRKKF